MREEFQDQNSISDNLNAKDIDNYLRQNQEKSLLRFITCGSVDDGKSTLIGRLLYDSRMIFEDQLAALERDSRTLGTQSDGIDFSLLVDGLAAEREQGITIDVAYRFFATEKRKFIVADTPGHEEYTRNMVTGASTADLAVVLVDARRGILTQTRRHSYLVHLLGVRKIVLAVNKMDLVSYSSNRFSEIVSDYAQFTKHIGIEEFLAIPISGLKGDNIVTRSTLMPWYRGVQLLTHLESVPVSNTAKQHKSFRMSVQWVNRRNSDFRGFAGQISSGSLRPGDRICVLPSGRTTTIKAIVSQMGELPLAVAGQSVMLTFSNEVDCSRGDVIAAAKVPCEVADQFEATVIWMADAEMLSGRSYLMRIGTQIVTAVITGLKYRTNIDTLERIAVKCLEMNSIGVVNISIDRAIPFDSYAINPDLGGFILIDRITNATVAAGLIHFALRRSHNIQWQALEVNREAHAAQKGQAPLVVWFTGLSGAGKSTIANLVEKKLYALGKHTFFLDGDNIRHGLNRDLGFTDADRVENVRRAGEVAKLMADAGLIVLAAFISPFRAERTMVRERMAQGEFLEVFVDTPIEVAEARDVKGLYRKARAGKLARFTGIDSPYEAPEAPDIAINTLETSAEEAAEVIVEAIISRQIEQKCVSLKC